MCWARTGTLCSPTFKTKLQGFGHPAACIGREVRMRGLQGPQFNFEKEPAALRLVPDGSMVRQQHGSLPVYVGRCFLKGRQPPAKLPWHLGSVNDVDHNVSPSSTSAQTNRFPRGSTIFSRNPNTLTNPVFPYAIIYRCMWKIYWIICWNETLSIDFFVFLAEMRHLTDKHLHLGKASMNSRYYKITVFCVVLSGFYLCAKWGRIMRNYTFS